MDTPKAKIFLSYVHDDVAYAKKIYSDLKRFGLNIWFDNEDLLPGQTWELEIEKAIEDSVYFLALFSSQSVDHVGHVQKELKLAFDKLDNYPQGGVYIIPVRLDDCNIEHTKIKKIHIVDLFPTEERFKDGIRKILAVVNPGGLLLRSEPAKLTSDEATDMIRKYGFFEASRNGTKRFQNKYKSIKGGKVIFDEATGLMWQQGGSDKELKFDEAPGLLWQQGDSDNYLIFEYALKYINDLNQSDFAGYNDWRLPTLEEAMSLMEPVKENDLYIDPVFDNEQSHIWTSDQPPAGERFRWVVYFSYGECYDLISVNLYVRAVRSSQPSGE